MAQEVLWAIAAAALALAAAGTAAHILRLPPLLGYLVAGLAVAPLWSMKVGSPHGLDTAAEVGVLFLLFLIGLELDLTRLRQTIKASAAVMPFDLLLPFVLAGGAAQLILGWSVTEAIALGIAVTLSSTIIGERLSSGPGYGSAARRRVLGVLLTEDVAAGAMLAMLVILGGGDASGVDIALDVALLLGALVLVTAVALLVVPRLLDLVARQHVHELLVIAAVAAVALFGLLGAWAGNAELGAFLAGVAAAEAGARFAVRNALQTVRDGAVALFFFASGLAVGFGPVIADPVALVVVAGVFLFAKVAVHVPAALAKGLGATEALQTGFALGALGEFNLILAAVAVRVGLASETVIGVLMGAMLILVPASALLVRGAPRIARLAEHVPAPLIRPIAWIATGLPRIRPRSRSERGKIQAAGRTLIANALLVVALLGLTAFLAPRAAAAMPEAPQTLLTIGTWAVGLAVAAPLLRAAFRAYRDIVWALVGLRSGERIGAGRVRVLMVDAVIMIAIVLVLAAVSIRVPATLPVLAAAAALAAGIAALAWRRLAAFHRTLEDSVTRVLGRDHETGELLDHLLQKHPWGIRSIAVSVPRDSPMARVTVVESRLADLSGASIAIIKRRGQEIVGPGPDETIRPGDTLVLMGDTHQLGAAEALVVAHGQSMQLASQSRHARLEDVAVEHGSPWQERTLADIDVRGTTGCMVAGVWPHGAGRPMRYEAHHVLHPGDRLLVVGTALQLERIHALAAAPADEEE